MVVFADKDGLYQAADDMRQIAALIKGLNYQIEQLVFFTCEDWQGEAERAFAGQIMKNGKSDRFKTSLILLIVGVVLTVAGLVWSIQMPIIKHIWTCSMTLFAGGISFLLMALFLVTERQL